MSNESRSHDRSCERKFDIGRYAGRVDACGCRDRADYAAHEAARNQATTLREANCE